MNNNRVPRGVPTGGQFAAGSRPTADGVILDDDEAMAQFQEQNYGDYDRSYSNKTWDDCEFIAPDQSETWSSAGFDPHTANKWASYGFGSKEALEWSGVGFSDPQAANRWRSMGTHPDGVYDASQKVWRRS